MDTTDLIEWDRRHVWHPFTQMQDWLAETPVVIERGEGNHLIDTQGRRYLDGVSSLWCNVHGHCKPELDAALRAQSERIAHTTMLGLVNVPATELAKRLVDLTPARLTRVFYSDAGATATEVAIKLALQYWQLRGAPERTRFLALTEGYHGDTLGAMSVGYSEGFHHFFQSVLHRAVQIDPPHVYRWMRGCDPDEALERALADARRACAEHGERLAAIMVEPLMQGAAGMWAQPVEYLPALRALADEVGALLICDEVATGFGRTGRMFAVEHAGVEPDLLCLGKGITGGYLPLAATLASEAVFEGFLAPHAELKAFFHGHTYTGNPLAAAVAVANLKLFESEHVMARVQERAARLGERLTAEVAPLEHVGDIRRWGLMTGIELVRDRATREPYGILDRIGYRVIAEARRHGVMLRPLGNVIILMPPLSITEAEMDELVGVTARAIATVTGGG